MKNYKIKFKIFFLTIFFLGFFGLAKNSQAASVTVCDSGCGYVTIVAALTAVGNGNHTITVQTPYSAAENVTVNKSGADTNNRLTLQGRIGDTVTVQRIYVTGDNIDVKNFNFSGFTSAYSGCLQLSAGKSNITLDNNTFHCSTVNVSAMQLYRGLPMNDNVVITNNKMYNNGYITPIGGSNVLFENNLIDGNLSSTGYTPDALWTWGHDVIFRNNEIKNLSDDGVNHVDFIQAAGNAIPTTGAYNITIENNYWHDGNAQLCNLETWSAPNYGGWEWRNNVFKNIQYRCNVGIVDVKFYNNTFDNVDWEPIHTNGGAISGFYNNSPTAGRAYCDNLIIVNNLSIGRELFLSNTGFVNPDCTGAVADYNFITSAAFGVVADQTQVHGDNGGDPKVTDQANNDYRLLDGSLAINAGATLPSFSIDKIGFVRPQGGVWDIGAYEYAGNDTTPPAAPSGLSVN